MIVYTIGDDESAIAAAAPLAALGIVGNSPALMAVANEADQRLRRALFAIETADRQLL